MDSINRNSIFSWFNVRLRSVLIHPNENFHGKLKNTSSNVCIALLSVSSSTQRNVLAIVSKIFIYKCISNESHMVLASLEFLFTELGMHEMMMTFYNHLREKWWDIFTEINEAMEPISLSPWWLSLEHVKIYLVFEWKPIDISLEVHLEAWSKQ